MDALPQWTSKIDKRGLDPLGMQNAGVVLYQALLPGISNITLRMRYYGFFCWLSDAYARRGVTTDFEIWRQWVRRAEALYALVCADATGEGGVGGIEWANQALQTDDDIIDFASAASTDRGVKQYLIQRLGVFGAAYFTQMQEMGLFEEGPNGIQRITAQAGLAAANAFRAAVGENLEASFVAAIYAGKVDRATLAALRPLVPSQIPEPSDEREMYEDTLFAAGPQAGDADRSRSASLSLILGVAEQDAERPTPESVRWALYDPPVQDLPPDLGRQRLLWEAYHCQDLFQVAAAGLLAWAIAIMSETEDGRPLTEIQGAVETRLAELDEAGAAASWGNYRNGIDAGEFDWRGAWTRLTGRRGSPEEKAWVAIALIAALQRRTAERDDLRQAMQAALPINGQARSIVTELRWFGHNESAQVAKRIGDYVTRRIVLRHSWVAMQKLRRQRDYTFLFEARDGRLVCLNGYQPVPTTPRLAPAIQFLEDVRLVSTSGLTDRGRALLSADR
ncbi:MAG: hypothetical protein V4530_09440 [Pseudomonadota bacterium]